ncbi:MAG: PIG-L family deacetylase [Colwellia sp.]|nr:PIG-L family deacetylase [Colwellia sp.]NQZ80643.1 PIG-L family deacetylase [Colwellia sp.]
MKNKVLVIVAHADDETLGCGGTLLKHRDNGDEVVIIFMTDGIGARNPEKNGSEEKLRMQAQKNVCAQLNVKKFYNFSFPDNRMDSVTLIDVVQEIEKVLHIQQPSIIYTHHGGDLNIDHRIVHQAVMTACRPQPNSSVHTILSFEVNSSTEWASENMGGHFIPNYYVDISSFIKEKEQLLNLYADEMRVYPHSRSIEAVMNLNKLRGNSVGLQAAEAFMLLRQIIVI